MGASRDCLTFFRPTSGDQTSQPIFTQNGSNDVDSGNDVHLAVTIDTFHTPELRAPKRSKFAQFLDLENYRSFWP